MYQMREPRVGHKHEEFHRDAEGKYQYRSAAEIAKAIRTDVKDAVKAGDLPQATYSVRARNYSGGCSVYLDATGVEGAWVKVTQENYQDLHNRDLIHAWNEEPSFYLGRWVLTEHGRMVKDLLESIHQAYQRDASDSQVDYFDVTYYGHADLVDPDAAEWHAKYKAAQKEKAAARKAAREARA